MKDGTIQKSYGFDNSGDIYMSDRKLIEWRIIIKLFPKISNAKIKEGVFIRPDIRELIDDKNFIKCLLATEAAAWASFKSVVRNFLGKRKSDDYRQIIGDLLRNYCKMGFQMSLKIQFLHSNETSLQFRHNEEFSSFYFTFIDRKPTSFITSLNKFVGWHIDGTPIDKSI